MLIAFIVSNADNIYCYILLIAFLLSSTDSIYCYLLLIAFIPFYCWQHLLLYSVQLRNDRAAIFTTAYALVHLYYTESHIRFLLKLRTDDYSWTQPYGRCTVFNYQSAKIATPHHCCKGSVLSKPKKHFPVLHMRLPCGTKYEKK